MAFVNTGYQSWKILEQVYADDTSVTQLIMPNIQQISPQAIIDGSVNTITYSYPSDTVPSGGIDGDVWYNPIADILYKKIAGAWTVLTDRVTNDNYIAPVINLTDCPLP